MKQNYINHLLKIAVVLYLTSYATAQDDEEGEDEGGEVDPRMSEAFLRGYPDNQFYQISQSENIRIPILLEDAIEG